MGFKILKINFYFEKKKKKDLGVGYDLTKFTKILTLA